MENTNQLRLSRKDREVIFGLWRNGQTYAEIAKRYNTYRQKPRAVVLSFRPTFADYRCHDHFRRLSQFRGSGSSTTA